MLLIINRNCAICSSLGLYGDGMLKVATSGSSDCAVVPLLALVSSSEVWRKRCLHTSCCSLAVAAVDPTSSRECLDQGCSGVFVIVVSCPSSQRLRVPLVERNHEDPPNALRSQCRTPAECLADSRAMNCHSAKPR